MGYKFNKNFHQVHVNFREELNINILKNFYFGLFFFLFIYGCQNKVDCSLFEKIDFGEEFQYPSKLIRNKKQLIHIFN